MLSSKGFGIRKHALAACTALFLVGCSSNAKVDEPYYGYSDGIDQDCADIGVRVFVGSNDPDRLDADGDGWGCESYGP